MAYLCFVSTLDSEDTLLFYTKAHSLFTAGSSGFSGFKDEDFVEVL